MIKSKNSVFFHFLAESPAWMLWRGIVFFYVWILMANKAIIETFVVEFGYFGEVG